MPYFHNETSLISTSFLFWAKIFEYFNKSNQQSRDNFPWRIWKKNLIWVRDAIPEGFLKYCGMYNSWSNYDSGIGLTFSRLMLYVQHFRGLDFYLLLTTFITSLLLPPIYEGLCKPVNTYFFFLSHVCLAFLRDHMFFHQSSKDTIKKTLHLERQSWYRSQDVRIQSTHSAQGGSAWVSLLEAPTGFSLVL